MSLKREDIQIVTERAVLVAVDLPRSNRDPEAPFAELHALAATAGATVVGELIQRRQKPDGKWYIGKGKVGELAELVRITDAALIIFDNDLSPSQIKAIEEATSCKVIDRSELILDIFANRATTHAAKLQVEIAQLQYTYPRLRAMWDHLGQIVGGAPVGIGTRGPGEQQLEIDRRIVQRRKRQLQRELAGIEDRKTREVEARNLDHYTIGLVGYTNAGKSTLFNRLTQGGAYADNRLFSTLATRIEKWSLGGGNAAMLSDTVGFIQNLPHHLVASFKSTLEETRAARLLLIVLDLTHDQAREQLYTVESTLDDIGADTQPRMLVLNKIDLLDERDADEIRAAWQATHPEAIFISAARGIGIDALQERVLDHMLGGLRTVTIDLPMSDGKSISFLEKRAIVLDREYDDVRAIFTARIGRLQIDQLLAGGADVRINGRPALETVDELWNIASQPRT
ncbi:MAG: GTPase HflX [Phycisphaerales bacterium]